MAVPNPVLLSVYGTEDVYLAKLAGDKKPIAAAIALPLLGLALMRAAQHGVQRDQRSAQFDDARSRGIQALQSAGDSAALRGNPDLNFMNLMYQRQQVPSADDTDLADLTKGSAAIADAAGRMLAKSAGIGSMLASAAGKVPGALTGALKAAPGALNQLPGKLMSGAQAVTKPLVSALPGIGRGGSLGTKALVGAAGVGLGYGAYRGAKALYNAGMAPAETRVQGAGPALPRYVNQYGVPTL